MFGLTSEGLNKDELLVTWLCRDNTRWVSMENVTEYVFVRVYLNCGDEQEGKLCSECVYTLNRLFVPLRMSYYSA